MNFDFNKTQNRSEKIADFLKINLIVTPVFSITSGSGFSKIWENFKIVQKINYQDIPGMPLVNIPGHSNILYLIENKGVHGLVFGGRFHLYDGHSAEIILIPLLVPNLLGVKNFIFMNAAGGLNKYFQIGDLMIISDGINFSKNKIDKLFSKELIDSASGRNLFDLNWIEKTEKALIEKNFRYQKGTYISVNGPNYETQSEIKMFRRLGADAIGMSTIFESISGAILGADIFAFSVITNTLKEVQTSKVAHTEVIEVLKNSMKKAEQLIRTALEVKFNL